jgi:hypothetical protein
MLVVPLIRDGIPIRLSLSHCRPPVFRQNVCQMMRGRWTLAACVGLMTACTDPTAPGPQPDVLTLEPSVPVAQPGQKLNPFIFPCPTPATRRGPSVRQAVPGSTATIAIPAGTSVSVAPIGGRRGAVFSIGSMGLIAFSYDDLFATYLRNVFDLRRLPLPKLYSAWCPVTVAGREAIAFVDPGFLNDADDKLTVFFGDDMAVLLTEPSGRRMNIRLIGARQPSLLGQTPSSVVELLDIVGSLQW